MATYPEFITNAHLEAEQAEQVRRIWRRLGAIRRTAADVEIALSEFVKQPNAKSLEWLRGNTLDLQTDAKDLTAAIPSVLPRATW